MNPLTWACPVSKIGPMKRDIAERLASTVVDGVAFADAQQIIATFLTQLARCPVCDGSGTFAFGRDVTMTVSDRHLGKNMSGQVTAGTMGLCPRCGSDDENASGKGDPDYVAWHCYHGDRDSECRFSREESGHKERRNGHSKCGWRIFLPYEPSDDRGT